MGLAGGLQVTVGLSSDGRSRVQPRFSLLSASPCSQPPAPARCQPPVMGPPDCELWTFHPRAEINLFLPKKLLSGISAKVIQQLKPDFIPDCQHCQKAHLLADQQSLLPSTKQGLRLSSIQGQPAVGNADSQATTQGYRASELTGSQAGGETRGCSCSTGSLDTPNAPTVWEYLLCSHLPVKPGWNPYCWASL